MKIKKNFLYAAPGNSGSSSDVISFSKADLENVASEFVSLATLMSEKCSSIRDQVTTIRGNWSGDEFNKAEVNLTAIDTAINSLESNCEEIKKAVNKTSESFNSVKYGD